MFTNQSKLEDGFSIVTLEERLEMVQLTVTEPDGGIDIC